MAGDAATESGYVFQKNQVIFREGQPSQVAYMVKRGAVSLYRVVNNRRVVLQRALPGQFFGELTLLAGEPAHANAEAEELTEVIPFDAETLTGLMLRSPTPVQRLLKHLLSRLRGLETAVAEQPSNNQVLSVCQILELLYRCQAQQNSRSRELPTLNSAEVSKVVRSILLIQQLELDQILDGLAKLNLIRLGEIKQAKYEKNVFGEAKRSGEQLLGRTISIVDPANFMNVARNISSPAGEGDTALRTPFTKELAYFDLDAFAEAVQAEPATIYKKMAMGEIPAELFFFERGAALAYAKEKGDAFFSRVKRRRLNLDELETVDDIVHLDDATLQNVFPELGFPKMLVLYAAAGEEARTKIVANLSRKMAGVIQLESRGMAPAETEVAEVEAEFYSQVRQAKGRAA